MNRILILTPMKADDGYVELLKKLTECNYKLDPITSLDDKFYLRLLQADIFLIYTKGTDPFKVSVAIGMALALDINVHIVDLLKYQAPEAWTSLPIKFYSNSYNLFLNFFFT